MIKTIYSSSENIYVQESFSIPSVFRFFLPSVLPFFFPRTFLPLSIFNPSDYLSFFLMPFIPSFSHCIHPTLSTLIHPLFVSFLCLSVSVSPSFFNLFITFILCFLSSSIYLLFPPLSPSHISVLFLVPLPSFLHSLLLLCFPSFPPSLIRPPPLIHFLLLPLTYLLLPFFLTQIPFQFLSSSIPSFMSSYARIFPPLISLSLPLHYFLLLLHHLCLFLPTFHPSPPSFFLPQNIFHFILSLFIHSLLFFHSFLHWLFIPLSMFTCLVPWYQ